MRIDSLLARLDTDALRRPDGAHTVALVVVNDTDAHYSGPVTFRAAFPVRTEAGAKPVTVCTADGTVVPSRLVESRVETRDGLPPGRALWSLTLEFLATDVPGRGWRTYGAYFAASEASRSADASLWEAAERDAPPDAPAVHETQLHPGDLPLSGSYGILETRDAEGAVVPPDEAA